jgi:hypothetical protein
MNPEIDRFRDSTGDDEPIGPQLVLAVSTIAAIPIRRRRASISVRTAAFGSLLLIAALVATTAWAVGVKSDVDRTFSEATSARQATGNAATSIQQAKSDLSSEEAAVARADGDNARLARQVENQAICAAAQRSDLASLRKIFDDSRVNFENASKGSRLFAASTAFDKAFSAAVADLVKAYRSAAAGNLSAANGWIRASNSQVSIAIKQAKVLDREIDKVNSTTDRITGAQTALDQRLDATAVMCG